MRGSVTTERLQRRYFYHEAVRVLSQRHNLSPGFAHSTERRPEWTCSGPAASGPSFLHRRRPQDCRKTTASCSRRVVPDARSSAHLQRGLECMSRTTPTLATSITNGRVSSTCYRQNFQLRRKTRYSARSQEVTLALSALSRLESSCFFQRG